MIAAQQTTNVTNTPKPNNTSSTTSNLGRRIELEEFIKEFRKFLGDKVWERYYSNLSKFILGKLSKNEYQIFINKQFLNIKDKNYKTKFIKYHNKFLLASLANAFREGPNPNNISNDGFGYLNTLTGKSVKKQKLSSDITEHEKLKKTIMSLTIKERRRIKNITENNDPSISFLRKKQKAGAVVQERYSLLPKIPAGVSQVNNNNKSMEIGKENEKDLIDMKKSTFKGNKNVNSLHIKVGDNKDDKNINLLQRNGNLSGQNTPTSATSSTTNTTNNNSSSGPSSNPGANVALWTQDVMNGINTLLSSETYELPDINLLRSRMTGIMRENGLLGEINDESLNIMIVGLENYLKNILETAIDTVRFRKHRYDEIGTEELEIENIIKPTIYQDSDSSTENSSPNDNNSSSTSLTSSINCSIEDPIISKELQRKRKITLTTEDIYDTFKLSPHIIEPNGIMEKISSVILKDDDYYQFDKLNNSGIIDLLPNLPHKKINKETVKVLEKFDNNVKNENNEGSKDELLWLIHDLLT